MACHGVHTAVLKSALPPAPPAAIVGPYDKRVAGQRSSLSWFFVDHPPGTIPDAGQRPEAAGCSAKALQTVQLVDGGGDMQAGDVAALLGGPLHSIEGLAQRYVAKRDGGGEPGGVGVVYEQPGGGGRAATQSC